MNRIEAGLGQVVHPNLVPFIQNNSHPRPIKK